MNICELLLNDSEMIPESREAPKIDFSYLEQYGNRLVYKLPIFFETIKFERLKRFEARVSNIYDISKFWMVINHKELEYFQKYLFKFYYMNKSAYQIPKPKIVPEVYCVAFSDHNFYRCVITNVTIVQSADEPQAQVHYIDYGMFGMVELKNLFYWCEKIVRVPQFAIRASIAGIYPTSKDSMWSTKDVEKFSNLVCDQVCCGTVVNVYPKQFTLDVHLNVCKSGQVISVHQSLIEDKVAVYANDKLKTMPVPPSLPFLFPSHKSLESGKLPTTLRDMEYQNIISIGSYFHKVLGHP